MELRKEKGRSSNHSNTNKGSVIIDAAMVLPVFIIAVSMVLSMITEAWEESSLYKDLCESVNNSSYVAETYHVNVQYLTETGETQTRHIDRTLYYRPFWGESDRTADDYSLVYIYPKNGVKYHQKHCSTVDHNSNYEVVTKIEAVDMGYLPCKLCFNGPDYFK